MGLSRREFNEASRFTTRGVRKISNSARNSFSLKSRKNQPRIGISPRKGTFAAPVSSYNRCGCLTDGVARQDMMAKHPQRLQREIVEFLGSHSETYDAAAGRIKDQGTL